jgi:biopolymer transport protein ExbB
MAGTVLGMISSFESLSSAAALDASLVAGGISEALITTAAGLLIALAAVIPLNIFTTMSENIELEIEDAASELVETVTMSAIHAAA